MKKTYGRGGRFERRDLPAKPPAPGHRPTLEGRDRPERRDQPERREGRFASDRDIVFGVEPVRELVAAAPNAVRVLHVRAIDQARFGVEIERVRAAGGRIALADESALERMAGREARHQGIIAEVREYNYASFEDLIAAGYDPIVLVDGVTDPRNLGALMRSAEGAGARAVILARDRTVGVTPAAIKSSAGAWVHLKIARCGNVARALEQMKQAGYWIVALAPGGATSIYELDAARKLVIVVGSEGGGVREIVKKTADFVAAIPMRGRVDSLNVSVAGAVALFEIARRRGAGGDGSSQR
ncbi:MAG TPA: 23S rRNA (guanosine(2251)-2'-O)-methyltransferase RlmB [Candidatus Binataceae bacterium]|nr:23S rRNA (guanosine(2251)-2'-O)-methyltransferase RlmB [Candidatus Binataceae bacterium]